MLGRRLSNFEPHNDLQRNALQVCERYVETFGQNDPQKSGLLIAGDGFGIGKTHLAIGVLHALVESRKSRRPMFVFLPAFLEAIRRSYDEKMGSPNRRLMQKAQVADVLVLDDLGAERTTEWVQEQLTIIANARWAGGLATIATTNARTKDIRAAIGQRAFSRLRGTMPVATALQGKDRR
jgi:DNA replication protein DnaC